MNPFCNVPITYVDFKPYCWRYRYTSIVSYGKMFLTTPFKKTRWDHCLYKVLTLSQPNIHLVKYVRYYDYLECVGQCRHVLSNYSIEYRGSFLYRQVSSFLMLVAMETKGTIPTLLHFLAFVQILLPDFG